MAKLLQPFNARDFDPTQGGTSLPVGRHPVIIESNEVKGNAQNTGGYVAFHLRIIDGPQKGGSGRYILNLYHNDAKTVEIAHRKLSSLCHVLNTFNVDDMDIMNGKPFIIDVELQKGEEAAKKGYTEIVKVYDMNGNEPGKQGNAAPAAQTTGQQGQGGVTGNQGWGQGGGGSGNGQWQQPAQNSGGSNWQQPGTAQGGQGAPAQNAGGWNQGAAPGGGQGAPAGQGQGGGGWNQNAAPGQQGGNGGGGQAPPWGNRS